MCTRYGRRSVVLLLHERGRGGMGEFQQLGFAFDWGRQRARTNTQRR